MDDQFTGDVLRALRGLLEEIEECTRVPNGVTVPAVVMAQMDSLRNSSRAAEARRILRKAEVMG